MKKSARKVYFYFICILIVLLYIAAIIIAMKGKDIGLGLILSIFALYFLLDKKTSPENCSPF